MEGEKQAGFHKNYTSTKKNSFQRSFSLLRFLKEKNGRGENAQNEKTTHVWYIYQQAHCKVME